MQSDVFVDMVDALGGNATPMPYGEVYSSIQTGVIDGAENNWPSFESSGHYEVAGYYTHLQRGQPVLFAHHMLAYVEMFDRDAARLQELPVIDDPAAASAIQRSNSSLVGNRLMNAA